MGALRDRVLNSLFSGDFRGWRSPEYALYRREFGFVRAIGIELESRFDLEQEEIVALTGYEASTIIQADTNMRFAEKLGFDDTNQISRSIASMKLKNGLAAGWQYCERSTYLDRSYDPDNKISLSISDEIKYLFPTLDPREFYMHVNKAVNALHQDAWPTTGSVHINTQELLNYTSTAVKRMSTSYDNIYMRPGRSRPMSIHGDLDTKYGIDGKIQRFENKVGSPFLNPKDLIAQLLATATTHRHKYFDQDGNVMRVAQLNLHEMSNAIAEIHRAYLRSIAKKGTMTFSPIGTLKNLGLGQY